MKTTSTYGATLLDVMGSDLTVVNAARVSFDKESDWAWCAKEDQCDGCDLHTWMTDCPQSGGPGQLKSADAKLIAYLARHNHWTPFAHPHISFRVSAPLFVARQLQKHQVGLAWNEVSRRYVSDEPALYYTEEWRTRPENMKQGSAQDTLDTMLFKGVVESWAGHPSEFYFSAIEGAWYCYKSMIDEGVCPEQARMVLPQSMMTEWVWTGSLAAFARVVKQRLDPHAQRECRPVAEDIAKALRENFPVSWMALNA